MTRDGTPVDERDGFPRPHVNAALSISVQSVVWTVLASTASIVVGVRNATAVLVAFGAIGIVDAIGSIALAYHFHHALRHDALSDELERLAHRVVLVGLFSVGSAAIVGGLVRLLLHQGSESSNEGVVIAALSLVALTYLSARKQQIARRISSAALRSDGHLSAIGAMQAAVTLVGTVTAHWLGWTWADAVATAVIGCVAVALAVATWRAEHRATASQRPRRGRVTPEGSA
jgi:divalent metal cation (Fe/Co/Zn/Cd) transporter